MSTIQEAYRGVDRGEQWQLADDPQWHIQLVNGVPHFFSPKTVDCGTYKPSPYAVLSDNWKRVPPTPRPIYLMLPCEKGKGTHDFGAISGLLHVSAGAQSADYRQVAFPLTVEDMDLFHRLVTFPAPLLRESIERVNRVRETLKLMKEAK